MSNIKTTGSTNGTGTFEIVAPPITTTETITLPEATTTLAGTTIDQVWTGSQRGNVTDDNDLSFDMSSGNNFACTPTALGTLTFTNITAGQSGSIYLSNTSNYAISKASAIKCPSSMLSAISATGYHWLSYYAPNSTTVLVSYAGALV